MNNTPILVMDVEAIGLYGEGFAVGMVLLSEDPHAEHHPLRTEQEFLFACSPEKAVGTLADHAWVKEHVHIDEYNCADPREVRHEFYNVLMKCLTYGHALLAGDVIYPVETSFVHRAMLEHQHRDSLLNSGPYPFLDIASMRFHQHDFGGAGKAERLPNELPAHNPLADARQSARLYMALAARKGRGA